MNKTSSYPEVYIFTSDKTNFILQATSYLFNKYWSPKQKVNVLGFSRPKFKLPANFNFISMGTDPGPDKWTQPIYKALKQIAKDEFLITMLDDHLPIAKFDKKTFDKMFALMRKDSSIVKYCLGYAPSHHPQEYRVIDTNSDYDVFELNQDAPYRLNVQINVWRTNYFLSHIKKPMSAWDFELAESELAKNDGKRMIGTRRRYALRWIERSAMSGSWKGKVNILGLSKADLKYLISQKILKPDSLQYGQHTGAPFEKYKYKFKITDLEQYYDKDYYHDLIAEYGEFYGLRESDIPSKYIPYHVYSAFTLHDRIPVRYWYINETLKGGSHFFSKAEVNQYINKVALRQNSYYGATDTWLYQALDEFPIDGSEVAIIGSTTPWYESVCLAYGGKPFTIEYNKIKTDDNRLTTITVEAFKKDPRKFDHALSISSVEHDGLGRYGDPIDPWGDLRAMDDMRKMVKPNGLLLFAVPLGVDTLYWNAHRLYGNLRLPLLLNNWHIAKVFGFDAKMLTTNLSSSYQPVFVLRNVNPIE